MSRSEDLLMAFAAISLWAALEVWRVPEFTQPPILPDDQIGQVTRYSKIV
jgi:hypothetical protein